MKVNLTLSEKDEKIQQYVQGQLRKREIAIYGDHEYKVNFFHQRTKKLPHNAFWKPRPKKPNKL